MAKTARIYTVQHLNQCIVDKLHVIRQLPFDVVVHVPRSGTIPASLIATYLIKPFCSVDEFCAGIVPTRKAEYTSLTRVLLVDDSLRTGAQMAAAVDRIKQSGRATRIETLAVYSTRPVSPPVDKRIMDPSLYLHEHSDDYYIFPWFMWKTGRLRKAMVDIDGVLCRDCLPAEDDDGAEYAKFLATAEPRFKPYQCQIGTLVTGRLEKYRPQTQDWLQRHGIEYRQIIMGPWKNQQQRREHGAGRWKAEIYRNSPAPLFIESSAKEAAIIHEVSGKTVWCVDTQEVLG